MINNKENKYFDKLYIYVHEHMNDIYDIYYDNNIIVKAKYDTDYETDNGLELDEKGYEEYCEMLFKPINGDGFIVLNYNTLPLKIMCNGLEIYSKEQ